MIKKSLGLSALMLASLPFASAEDVTLNAEAGGQLNIAGSAGAATVSPVFDAPDTIFLRSRDFASGAVRGNLGYLRFNLQSLSNPNIQYARLSLRKVGGDTAVTSRVAIFGMEDLPGNSPQDWTTPFAAGAEFDDAMFQDFASTPGASPVDLGQVADFSEQEAISGGTLITLESPDFIEWLQTRADDDGLVTLLVAFPSAGGSDRSLTYASYNYGVPELRPTLEVTYADASLPTPPQNLAATDIEYTLDPVVQLGWDPVPEAFQYHVFRRGPGEDEPTQIGTVGANAFTDTDVELLETYYYSVSAESPTGVSIPSLELPVTLIDLSTPPPSVPDGITLINGAPDSIELDWSDSSDTLEYEVLRSTDSDQGFQLVGMPLQSALIDDANVLGFETYYYIIGAIGPGGRSGFSPPFEVGPRFVPGNKPSRPKDLTLIHREPYRIAFSWKESQNADAYVVARSTMPDREFQNVDTIVATSFEDTFALYPEQTYYYQVTGIGEGGYSQESQTFRVDPVLTGYRKMERIGRAPVAVPSDDGVLVSWRLLGTDPHDVAFNLYRDGKRLNQAPLDGATNYLDPDGAADSAYELRVVHGSVEQPGSAAFGVWAGNYLPVPIQAPPGGQTPDGVDYTYTANDASVADLDGDGEYEIVLKWDPTNSKDNSQFGYTGNVYLDAYELDGSLLWRVDLGINIRAGAHYTQFMVYDFDGDGAAELICKTADGTVDGQGTVIGDPNADYRNAGGFILSGPEFLTAFEGETGAVIDTVSYIPTRHPTAGDFPTPGQIFEIWGDDYGNRIDRFLAGVAYFDGENPSFFACRGQYRGQGGVEGRTVIAAFDLVDGQLVERWVLDSLEDGPEWAGQGHHQLSVGDADADGKDEIMYGGMVVDDDGQGLYSTLYGTGDALHFGDFDPTRPGLEFFAVKEDGNAPVHVEYRDPATGDLIWGVNNGRDTGRGLTADIDPMFPGGEVWGAANLSVWDSSGAVIGQRRPSINFATWWDGDPLRELTDGISVRKWDVYNESEVPVLVAQGAASNNGTKANSALQADLFGDWREEVVFRSEDSSELRIYATSDPTDLRIVTLMHDPMYRLAVAWQNNGYNQPPHPSFFIGNNMPTAPWPRLVVDPVPTIVGNEAGDGAYHGKVVLAIDLNQADAFENQYRIDGSNWKTYRNPITLNKAGVHLVEFRTLDESGNELASSATALTILK